MNRGQLAGGIIFLACAGLLGVAMFALPEGKFVFTMGDSNVPWVPVLVLAGIGVALISTAWRRRST